MVASHRGVVSSKNRLRVDFSNFAAFRLAGRIFKASAKASSLRRRLINRERLMQLVWKAVIVSDSSVIRPMASTGISVAPLLQAASKAIRTSQKRVVSSFMLRKASIASFGLAFETF
jgi:hypothetical protein